MSSSGPSSTEGKKIIFTPRTSYMCDILTASVVIRLRVLFILCIKSTRNSFKLTAAVSSAASSSTSNSETTHYPPICPPYICDGCSLLCFLLQIGLLSLSLWRCPLLLLLEMCYQPLTSPPSLQNCAPQSCNIIFFYSQLGSGENLQEAKNYYFLKIRKRDQETVEMYPRFFAGEKTTPAVRLSFYSLHRCAHTYTLSLNMHLYIYYS